MLTRRNISGYLWVLVIACGAVGFGGCSTTPKPSPRTYGLRRTADADRATIMAAAEAALLNAGFDIDRREPEVGLLTTHPRRRVAEGEPTQIDVFWKPNQPTRELAEIRIAQTAGDPGLFIYCKVVVQEEATEAYRFLHRDHVLADQAGETPIDTYGGVSKEQHEVWRTLRRDKRLEQELLSAIEAILKKTGNVVPTVATTDPAGG
jgi:hypothetical protein